NQESLQEIAKSTPRVVLLDAGDARQARFVRRLVAAAPGCGIIAMGTWNEEKVVECAEAGVGGYLEHDASPMDLVQAVRELANGEFHCPPRIAAVLLRRAAAAATRDRPAA